MDRPVSSRERANVRPRSNADRPQNAAQLLTTQEAAARLCMSREWVRKKVQRREIPFIRLGRCVRFTEAQLAEIIRGGVQTTCTPTPRGTARSKL